MKRPIRISILCAALLAALLLACSCAPQSGLGAGGRVTVSIVSLYLDDQQIADGQTQDVILDHYPVTCKAGQTVADALKLACDANSIRLDATGSGILYYVQQIDTLRERDHGSGSGWVYRVNGADTGVSSGSQAVNAGDDIIWYYSLNMGDDVPVQSTTEAPTKLTVPPSGTDGQ